MGGRVGLKLTGWLALVIASISLSGCLGETIGVIAAPEIVASQAAAGTTAAAAQGIDPGTLGQMTDLSSTISDLSNIIASNPNAANIPELEQLQSDLTNQQIQDAQSLPGQGSLRGIPPTDEFDRRKTDPDQPTVNPANILAELLSRRPGDAVMVRTPPALGQAMVDSRRDPVPFVAITADESAPQQPTRYPIDFQPVRLP